MRPAAIEYLEKWDLHMSKVDLLSGDSLIYTALRDMLDDPEADYGDLPIRLIAGTSIWFPPTLYAEFPILLPWIVRDPTCRKGIDGVDEWGAPDASGYQRDDNSAIKGLPKPMVISGPKGSPLVGKHLGKEFVASHIWRKTVSKGPLTNRIPELNSFVPNLVWLPRQIAKLSDREGGPIQQALQTISAMIYKAEDTRGSLAPWIDHAWRELSDPKCALHGLTSEHLHYFTVPETFVHFRRSRIHNVVSALDAISNGEDISSITLTHRYKAGLPKVTEPARFALRNKLGAYLDAT